MFRKKLSPVVAIYKAVHKRQAPFENLAYASAEGAVILLTYYLLIYPIGRCHHFPITLEAQKMTPLAFTPEYRYRTDRVFCCGISDRVIISIQK